MQKEIKRNSPFTYSDPSKEDEMMKKYSEQLEEREKAKGHSTQQEVIVEEKKDPNEKTYLLLLYIDDIENPEKEPIKTFEEITGRKAAYYYIKNMIEYLDINKSKILAETVSLQKAATVYRFMKYMEDYFPDENFNIEEYNYGGEEYEKE